MSEGARGAQEGKHNRALRGTRAQRMAGTGAGIGCRPGALLSVARFRERPAMNAGQAWDMHYEKDLGTAASGATALPVRVRRFKGR
jgi:hypothetical protein